jgi:hypothetical protein
MWRRCRPIRQVLRRATPESPGPFGSPDQPAKKQNTSAGNHHCTSAGNHHGGGRFLVTVSITTVPVMVSITTSISRDIGHRGKTDGPLRRAGPERCSGPPKKSEVHNSRSADVCWGNRGTVLGAGAARPQFSPPFDIGRFLGREPPPRPPRWYGGCSVRPSPLILLGFAVWRASGPCSHPHSRARARRRAPGFLLVEKLE